MWQKRVTCDDSVAFLSHRDIRDGSPDRRVVTIFASRFIPTLPSVAADAPLFVPKRCMFVTSTQPATWHERDGATGQKPSSAR